jgi:hypothetical protein
MCIPVFFGFACLAAFLLVVKMGRVVGAIGTGLCNVLLLPFVVPVILEIVGAYFFIHTINFRKKGGAKIQPSCLQPVSTKATWAFEKDYLHANQSPV